MCLHFCLNWLLEKYFLPSKLLQLPFLFCFKPIFLLFHIFSLFPPPFFSPLISFPFVKSQNFLCIFYHLNQCFWDNSINSPFLNLPMFPLLLNIFSFPLSFSVPLIDHLLLFLLIFRSESSSRTARCESESQTKKVEK